MLTPHPATVLRVRLGARGHVEHWRGQFGPEEQDTFIKVLIHDEPEAARRFTYEGQIIARLSHPGVLKLLSSAPHQHAFEWLGGESLRKRLDRWGTLPLRCGAQLLTELLHTLGYLHSNGAVHHDIKPENVMLPPGTRPAVLVDFGMAFDAQQPHDLYAGTRMGTPQFMAPEQFRGRRGDPRSDLYAAAALLFDALTGSPPYPNALGWLAGFDDARAPLPAQYAPLGPFFEAALQRDPERRPQSAAQMLSLARRALEQM